MADTFKTNFESDIDLSSGDTGFEEGLSDVSPDVDTVMDAGDDDFAQFETPEAITDTTQPTDLTPATDTTQPADLTPEDTKPADLPDFSEPIGFYTQGINEYGYESTCGPTSQANTLNRLLGTDEFTENRVLSVAVDNKLCYISDDPAVSGGTTTEQFMKLYDKINEQAGGKIETELFEYDAALGVEAAAAKLDTGAVLNVAVDSKSLWGETRDYVDSSGAYTSDLSSDHWITVTGAQRDASGNVLGFDIIDSGGGVAHVSAEKYREICFGTEEHRVLDPTCIAVTKKEAAAQPA
jgi:hypothetical protein